MSRYLRPVSYGMLSIAVLLASTSLAPAQMESREAIALQNQILELRHQLETLAAQRGGAQPYAVQPAYPPPAPGTASETAAQLLTRVTSLEEQVRQLRGRVDELENALQRTSADLGKQLDDLKFQMQSPGGGAAAPSSVPTSPPPTTLGGVAGTSAAAGSAAKPGPAGGPRTPELALQEGYAALARRDYPGAERAAQEVLSKRASPRAYDAQYLLAQSLAGQRQWSRAAIAYDDTYVRAPKGGHAEAALVGLATSLAAINEKRAACDTLTKLHNEFPRPRSELRDDIAAVSQRAGCRG